MSSVLAPEAGSAALSLGQHKAALWSDDRVQVYAVVMGTRIPQLPARLAEAELGDYHCLLPGALLPAEQRDAPYLLRLKAQSAFTDWLLFEAAAGLGDWGVVVRSASAMLPLRSHLRSLLEARLPTGEPIRLAWMDAPILMALLPLFDASSLSAFMGPVQTLVTITPATWTSAHLELGRLVLRSVPVAKAA